MLQAANAETGAAGGKAGNSARAAGLLLAARAVRETAFGWISIALPIYWRSGGLSAAEIGTLYSVALLGSFALTVLFRRVSDRWGYRTALLASSGLWAAMVPILLFARNPLWLGLAAALGSVSPTGKEVGPYLSVEQTLLAVMYGGQKRLRAYTWFNFIGYASGSAGALLVGALGWSMGFGAYRVLLWGYMAAGLIQGMLYARLPRGAGWRGASESSAASSQNGPAQNGSAHNESADDGKPMGEGESEDGRESVDGGKTANGMDEPISQSLTGQSSAGQSSTGQPPADQSPDGRRRIYALSALFALDAFGSGFIVQSLLAFWFYEQFHFDLSQLGLLFFGTNVLSALSSFGAAWLGERIGLLNTMVFTHIPSNVFLCLIPLMPTPSLAVVLLLLRHVLSQMDVPTRQAYTMALVAPSDRVFAATWTNGARNIGSALTPALAGVLLTFAAAGWPFYLAGALKIGYDLLTYQSFRRVPLRFAEHR
ncbi:MAG: MFS transporter [Bacilli bacterium]